MRLYADCGNTAIKLTTGADAPVLRWQPPAPPPALFAAADELVLVASGAAQHQALMAAWAGRGPLRELGVDVPLPDCGQYPGLGRDRLCAGQAAVARLGSAAIVIDCGTATTLSAWASDGHFRGGLILPGAAACLQGLHEAAPGLPLVEPVAEEPAPDQHETRAAIAAAMAIGYPAMIERCCQRLAAATGISACVVAGAGPLDLPASWQRVEHLVLAGLIRLVP
ncbi:MAG: type III pantothenate kinase [Planctomycetota bacterium]|jgi:pantothenate kinase type III